MKLSIFVRLASPTFSTIGVLNLCT